MTRKSRREIEDSLAGLERNDPNVAGLIRVLSSQAAGRDVSPVAGHPGFVEIGGEQYRLTENAREKLLGAP